MLAKPKIDKDGMPEWMWLLTGDDICRGRYDGLNDTHCLLGWIWFHIPIASLHIPLMENLWKHIHGMIISDFNDDPKNSKDKIARTWNRAVKDAGYTVPKEYL